MRSSLRLSTALVAAASCSLLAVAPALAEDVTTESETTATAPATTGGDSTEAGGDESQDSENSKNREDSQSEGSQDEGSEDDDSDGADDSKDNGGSSEGDMTEDKNTTPWLRILDASSKSKAAPILGVILAVVSLLLAAYNTFGSKIPALQNLIKGIKF
ncbi:hypothetical protein HMPREF3227_01521 [Corynebacterium sp. CMW7794]|uniref:hypothetical protein n=1 Tax=Corynebacterium TaxID=1716 RepID=UPI0007975FAC|nr:MULTISPECIES: hypothetical protein [Corynebacterium]KXB56594.1 hypothetical protein HMPREF0307_00285 [Corynebacterium sp. DNF00584]KXI17495.1 hypothetical protein HMPREF3227_01521 [Corynebacterium sp. CMW7794]MBF9011729.1 hypothetical protein [Corynebacterium phoceense]OFL79751.1 hypothetical protein HMPREF2748_08225 [Corynebacterium sp. HMSC077B05]OFN41135.1 hypothetical protein HMPREF2559_03160 [Corynebacterium sp. HMSC072G08]